MALNLNALSDLAAAVTLIAGADAKLSEDFVNSLGPLGISASGISFAVNPNVDRIRLELDFSGPILEIASPRPAWLESLHFGNPSIPQIVADVERYIPLPERISKQEFGKPRAFLDISEDGTETGSDIGACWAIIEMLDALDIIGDPSGALVRFTDRLTPFIGHLSLGRVATATNFKTFIHRHMTVSETEQIPKFVEAFRDCLKEILPPEGPTLEAYNSAFELMEMLIPQAMPEGVKNHVVVSIGFKDSMPPECLTLKFKRLPLKFIVSVIEYLEQEINVDRIGTLFGLCLSDDEDGYWAEFSLTFAPNATPDFRLHISLNTDKWLS